MLAGMEELTVKLFNLVVIVTTQIQFMIMLLMLSIATIKRIQFQIAAILVALPFLLALIQVLGHVNFNPLAQAHPS